MMESNEPVSLSYFVWLPCILWPHWKWCFLAFHPALIYFLNFQMRPYPVLAPDCSKANLKISWWVYCRIGELSMCTGRGFLKLLNFSTLIGLILRTDPPEPRSSLTWVCPLCYLLLSIVAADRKFLDGNGIFLPIPRKKSEMKICHWGGKQQFSASVSIR